ncbi:MAG TPA: hypothetical protein VJV79_34300 [Polyangiaceae bacterium]|nr:hypothetical protein [Polyangiaceae bacterium]
MTPDDAHTSHSHGFELPDQPVQVVRNQSRPWRAVAGVAVCLGLAGIVTGLIVAHRQRVSDEHLTSDALQREELRDGWRALGAAAARDAQNKATQAQASSPAIASAAPPNVVVVNVPTPSTPAAPSNVTTVNVPNSPALGSNGAAPASSDMRPGYAPTQSPGYAPTQSLPPINYSPIQGYLPTQSGYPFTPPSGVTASPSGVTPGNVPPANYGTPSGGVPPMTPPVGNGSIPGSTPNPALPNNGLVGSAPVPGLPNGSLTGNSPQPVTTVPLTQ